MIVQSIKLACSNCNLRELCMPLSLNEEELQKLDNLVTTRHKIVRGDTLYRNGEKFLRCTQFAQAFSKHPLPLKTVATKSLAFKWLERSLV